jgi:hypothetical protein
MIREAALAAIKMHKSLLAGQAESFATTFLKGVDKLSAAQDKLTKSRQLLPAMLPEALKEPDLPLFLGSRKRAITARESAEQQEKDQEQQHRRAQKHQDKNDMWATQMRADMQIRYSQHESQNQTQLVPDTQLSELPKTPSIPLSDDSSTGSSADSSTDPETDNSNPEPRRSGRVRKPTRDKASQLSQEAAAAAAMAKAKEGKRKRSRKMRKSIPTSQLLKEFGIDTQ